MSRVLIAGESWVTHSTHIKGMDTFTTSSYEVGVEQLRRALEGRGHEVRHLPAHLVPMEFPDDERALSQYDVVVVSDIGANSIQLAPGVFERARPGADRLAALRAWVGEGGGLLMIGGYLSFTGFEGKAAYRNTVLHDVLPVELLAEDDRVELPAGAQATVALPGHPALGGLDSAPWPHLLGYNRVLARPGSTTLATVNGDPLVVVGEHGNGRSAAFTSDCSPHWAPTAFCEDWSGYGQIFGGLIEWLAR
ncbi:glutamine amidotransferase [Saccharopolyspora phatthalungensis]|uniref:Putative membrane protein n=1 Tax=Saccharopolyspora phatthalungensis TaxID=664693 RepID=A0A840QEE1_9PSEU|nr:glutamine amidotransferase [Saccharopolyspora phatthalungensis]MBB5159174.1 putative membrane protein [Saccharopolyspora phatthalungensis]